MNRLIAIASLLLFPGVLWGATIPTDCETSPQMLDRLYSYFGGVSSFSVFPSGEAVFSGAAMGLTINFQPSMFAIAGVAVGTLGVSSPGLDVDPAADTFSLTIKGPDSGSLKFYVLIREDDDEDGIIDLAVGDDEWQSPEFFIPAGATTTFNIPAADFFDPGTGSGNGVRNFTDTTRMALLIDVHSRTLYPGGILTTPRTIHLDHVGFFSGEQTPPPICTGDADGSHDINFADITSVLTNYGAAYEASGPGDANVNGIVDFADITSVLASFGLTCP